MDKNSIRPWGKTELALAYTQGFMSEHSALNWFNTELSNYPGLMDKLKDLGYTRGQKILRIAQVKVIFEALGEP